MKRMVPFFALLLTPLLLFSQRTKLQTNVDEESGVVLEAYHVLRKYKYTKHGSFKSYYEDGAIKEVGEYDMNKKTGLWKTFHENGDKKSMATYQKGKLISEERFGVWRESLEDGLVHIAYNYDLNQKLKPEIKTYINYPPKARANGIEGVVLLKLILNDHCEIVTLEVVEGIGWGCDEEALRAVQQLYEFIRKYDIESCVEMDVNYPIIFKLN